MLKILFLLLITASIHRHTGQVNAARLTQEEKDRVCLDPQSTLPARGIITADANHRVLVCLKVKNGEKTVPVPFIVDTGSPRSWIDEEYLGKLGVRLDNGERVRLAVPPNLPEDPSDPVAPEKRTIFDVSYQHIEGDNILGMNYFRQFGITVEVDYQSNWVSLSLGSNILAAPVIDPVKPGEKGKLSDEEQRATCATENDAVPASGRVFFDNAGRVAICFKVSNGIFSRPIPFVVDTGSPNNLIRKEVLRDLNIVIPRDDKGVEKGRVQIQFPVYNPLADIKPLHKPVGRPTGSPPIALPTEFEITPERSNRDYNLIGYDYMHKNGLKLTVDYATGHAGLTKPIVIYLQAPPPVISKVPGSSKHQQQIRSKARHTSPTRAPPIPAP